MSTALAFRRAPAKPEQSRKNRTFPYLFLVVIGIILPAVVFAHSGGVDTYGCHNQISTRTYHCHAGALSDRSFASKSAMLDMLKGTPAPAPTVPPPATAAPAYNRHDYLPSWADADADCQNTRHEVLIAESRIPVLLDASGCTVLLGWWNDPYTGRSFTNPADVDIDHLVPLKEAHVSGAALWSTTDKRAFANDLGNSRVLIAVDDATNSAKGDKDPAEWMPPNAEYHCEYVHKWVAVKSAYGLAMDAAEAAFIASILNDRSCALLHQPSS